MGQTKHFSTADKCASLNLLREYRQTGCKKIMERLVRLNVGLVKKEVSYWCSPYDQHYEDILQVGMIGLMGAIERFELNRGYAFSSFAVRHIRGEIQHYIRDKNHCVRIPRRWLELRQQGVRTAQLLRSQLHREPTEAELIQALGVSVAEWQEAKLAHQNSLPLSLDTPVHQTEDNALPLGECLPDPRSSNGSRSEEVMYLHQALEHLEQRTREMLESVYLQDLPQRQVADIFGVSTVTVSRQVKKAIETLRLVMVA